MTRRVLVEDAGADIAGVLDTLCAERRMEIVDRDGAVRAVLVRPDDFEHYQDLAQQELAEAVRALRRANEDADPDEVLREITAITEEIRQEHYGRARRD